MLTPVVAIDVLQPIDHIRAFNAWALHPVELIATPRRVTAWRLDFELMLGLRWWRAGEDRVVLMDREPRPELEPSAALLRIAAEGVILQDKAEVVLVAVSRHGHLGVVAPLGGPLVRRFFALREQLPVRCADPQLDQLRANLDTILYHHAMQVATALEFLAFDERSAELRNLVSRFSDLGAPARLLDEIYRDLKERQSQE